MPPINGMPKVLAQSAAPQTLGLEQRVQQQIGALVFQVLALQAENESLRAAIMSQTTTPEPAPAP